MRDESGIKAMLKEAGILFAITLIAGLALGFFFELTKEPRRIQQEKAVQEACAAVFSEKQYIDAGISFRECEYTPSGKLSAELAENGVTIGKVYGAFSQAGLSFGYVVEAASGRGYGGEIVLYVGVRTDGTVNGVSIRDINETPGFGMEAPDVLVPQFAGRRVESFVFTKTGAAAENEVDAISGATRTTGAVTNAVNGGLAAAWELLGLEGGDGNE